MKTSIGNITLNPKIKCFFIGHKWHSKQFISNSCEWEIEWVCERCGKKKTIIGFEPKRYSVEKENEK